jgi:hypothetical protein
MEEATWLSPIVVVLKKNGKLQVATKNDYYPLPFMREILDVVVDMKSIYFWMAFRGISR